MSLDQNLFTLQVKPSETDPTVVDLVESTGNILYRKQCISGPVYAARVYDFVSQSLLVTATAPSTTSKVKILELRNPSVPVELKASGTFTVKWSFKWEEHEFEWKREECFIIRKPDPPVLVAITKEIPGRVKSAAIQVLDYNLNRFDIEDRKGLELVILTALLTFLDVSNSKEDETAAGHQKSTWTTLSPFGVLKSSPPTPPSKDDSPPRAISATDSTRVNSSPALRNVIHSTTPVQYTPPSALRHSTPLPVHNSHSSTSNESSPTPPPTPPFVHPQGLIQHNANLSSDVLDSPVARRGTKRAEAGVDRIAQMHALRSVFHAVTVYEEGTIEDYAKFCWRMLKDEAISFITIQSANSLQVQKVLEVVEATKSVRFRKGPFIELLQFVTYFPLPVGTTQKKLEERARLSSMTPKQIQKAQKQKEKEEKKRKAKAKKGKGHVEHDTTLEVEEYRVPPKSVHIRLTKVEIQTPPVKNIAPEKDKGAKGPKVEVVPPHPRFLVQKAPSDIPSRYTNVEEGQKRHLSSRSISAAPVDVHQHSSPRLLERRTVSDAQISTHNPSRPSHAIQNLPAPVVDRGSNELLHSSASQPFLPVVAHHAKPHRSKSDTLKLSKDTGRSPPVDIDTSKPPLPPRKSSITKIKEREGPVAGSSRLSPDAPPSYTDLAIVGVDFPIDSKH